MIIITLIIIYKQFLISSIQFHEQRQEEEQ